MQDTYRILNKSLTYFGCDRVMFVLAFVIGWESYSILNSLIAGAVMWTIFFQLGRIKARDPILLPLKFNGGIYSKRIYDPGKRDPFAVRFYD